MLGGGGVDEQECREDGEPFYVRRPSWISAISTSVHIPSHNFHNSKLGSVLGAMPGQNVDPVLSEGHRFTATRRKRLVLHGVQEICE